MCWVQTGSRQRVVCIDGAGPEASSPKWVGVVYHQIPHIAPFCIVVDSAISGRLKCSAHAQPLKSQNLRNSFEKTDGHCAIGTETVILAEDEASLYLQATTAAVWAPRGNTPVVHAHPGRDKVNFYGIAAQLA